MITIVLVYCRRNSTENGVHTEDPANKRKTEVHGEIMQTLTLIGTHALYFSASYLVPSLHGYPNTIFYYYYCVCLLPSYASLYVNVSHGTDSHVQCENCIGLRSTGPVIYI